MIGLTKRDVAFLVVVAIVVLIFAGVSADASTHVWFLLFAAAMWTARRARREAQVRTQALEKTLQAERAERIEDVARLTETIAQLGQRTAASPMPEQASTPSAAPAIESTVSVAASVTPEPPELPDYEPPPPPFAAIAHAMATLTGRSSYHSLRSTRSWRDCL
jgi:hypothetical protein